MEVLYVEPNSEPIVVKASEARVAGDVVTLATSVVALLMVSVKVAGMVKGTLPQISVI